MVTGVAGLVAGAMSMAAGEYVSVHSQADTEHADLARERAEQQADRAAEQRELTAIYVGRGLEPGLAEQVSAQLMVHGALAAHVRDELGISGVSSARPLQAALASAASFAAGAALPLAVAAAAPLQGLAPWMSVDSLAFPAALGAVAAPHRRRRRAEGGMAGRLLGCVCDGDHGGGGRLVRGHCLTASQCAPHDAGHSGPKPAASLG